MKRACPMRLGKRQVEQLTRAAAVDVDAFYAVISPRTRPVGDVLLLSADGKGIVMRPDTLQEATSSRPVRTSHPARRPGPSPGTGASVRIVVDFMHVLEYLWEGRLEL
jgi:hypothetical protein